MPEQDALTPGVQATWHTGPMTETASFRFRYRTLRPLLSALGMGPALSTVELDGDTLRVRMGWAFRAADPGAPDHRGPTTQGLVGGIGVHGWRGRWLVNGAATGLLVTSPSTHPCAPGPPAFPSQLRELTLSLEDPDTFVAALGR